jgi:N-acetylglucosamine malate deacetylase 1
VTSVLVVGAHPDDEAMGCGGALRAHAIGGDRVTAVFLTSGEAGGHGIEHPGETREQEARSAAGILGIAEVQFWRERDGRLRASRTLIERLANVIRETRAAVMYAPHAGDDHPDHRAAARIAGRAAAAAARRVQLRHYEIWSPIPCIDHVVDISEVIEQKLGAIRAYESQCDVMRFDDAFAGLARYRGEMHSWPGGPYAEVFCTCQVSIK